MACRGIIAKYLVKFIGVVSSVEKRHSCGYIIVLSEKHLPIMKARGKLNRRWRASVGYEISHYITRVTSSAGNAWRSGRREKANSVGLK
jgi:hypothetical protein